MSANFNAGKWNQKHADYMNMYDKLYGALETVTPEGIKIDVTE